MAYLKHDNPTDPHKLTVDVTKKRFGVDKDGKSIHHKMAGAKGGAKSTSRYFRDLKESGETGRLKEISDEGVKARRRGKE